MIFVKITVVVIQINQVPVEVIMGNKGESPW